MKRFLSLALISALVFAMIIPVLAIGGYTAEVNSDASNMAKMTDGKAHSTAGFKLFSASGVKDGYAYCADINIDFKLDSIYDSRTEAQYSALTLDQINRIKAALTYIINDSECQKMPPNAYHTLIQLVIWEIGNGQSATLIAYENNIIMSKLQKVRDLLNDDNYLKNYKTMYPTYVKELEFFVNCGGSQPLVRFLTGTRTPGTSYGSVTATNNYKTPLVVPGSNHFTYAKLKVADLQDGVALDLVVGNKIEKVGTAFVQIIDGKLVITVNGDVYQSKVGAVAYTTLPTPKNGNIHSLKEFSHNNQLTINLPAADKDGYIYLYVHFDTLQFYK